MPARHFLLALSVIAAMSQLHVTVSFGQQITTNPYAKLERTSATWPPFYKPDPTDAQYSKLMAGGWCQVTGKRARLYYESKRLDVNTLPTSTLRGKITEIRPDGITVVDEKSPAQSIHLVVHEDLQISSVRVQGKASREAIQVGEFVHFVGAVNETGLVREVVNQIDLISPQRSEPIVSNHVQNISGKIVHVHGRQLTILSAAEKVRRLTLELGTEASIAVNLNSIRHASVGDSVAVEGRIYRGLVGEQTIFFAEELNVTLANPLRPKATPHAAVATAAK